MQLDGSVHKLLSYTVKSDTKATDLKQKEEYTQIFSDAEEDLEALIAGFKEIEEELKFVIVFTTGSVTCDLKGVILEIRRLKNEYQDLYIDLHHVGKIEFEKGYRKSDRIHVLIRNTLGAVIANMTEYKKTSKVGIEKIGPDYFSYEYLGEFQFYNYLKSTQHHVAENCEFYD